MFSVWPQPPTQHIHIYNTIKPHRPQKMNRSNLTSISFTVQDDLISQSSLNSTRKTAFHGLKPFAKKYGLGQQPLDERPLPNRMNKEIIERAQMDAYREMGQHLFNPFEHKLGGGFIPKESDLYMSEKQRQIELLKRQEQQMMRSKNSYTIVFNNEQKSKHNLQKVGKNILDGGEVPSIAEYYNRKFKKPAMEGIEEEGDQEEGGDQRDAAGKKVNNFVSSAKKSEKVIPETKPVLAKPKEKVVKPKSQEQQKSYKNIGDSKKQNSKKNSQGNQDREKEKQKVVHSSDNLKQTLNKPKPKVQQSNSKSQNNIVSTKKQQQKPPFNLNTSNKNIEIVKKQQQKKSANNNSNNNKKPPIPKAPAKVSGGKKKYSQVYEGPDRNLVQQLERELVECPTIGFEDIAELQVAKSLLQEAVLLPRLMPQFFQGIRKAMRGILLFGPPGTGKTLLAKAIAKDNIFFNVSASSLASKWKGQSQKMVRLLFQMAKYHSPSVIFFDEIDCIGSKRSQNEHESARKVKTELLVQMDGVGSTENQVFVLAATNRPWDLDEALRRRLEKRIYIPLPGAEGRKKMFDINLKGLKISEKINWQKLVDLTKGCSGADICNVCRDAAYMPMRRKITQLGGIAKLQDLKQSQLIDEEVLEADLMESAKKVKPSVGKEDLKRYQAWMAEFGSS